MREKLQFLKEKFNNLSPKKKILLLILGGGFLVLLISLISYGAYSYYFWNRYKNLPQKAFEGTVEVSGEGEPKEIPSPINGVLYSKKAAESWEKRRPMAVMFDNHVVARPQTGLSKADLIYEAVAEGGISRILAIFHARTPEKVGPVRSARVYFIDWAREYDAWYAHWGGSQVDPNNLSVCYPEADSYSRMRTIFVPSVESGEACWREFKSGLATEHTLYCSVPKLYEAGYKRYPDQVREFRPLESWQFKDDAEKEERGEKNSVEFNFWNIKGFNVKWEYNPLENVYLRFQGEEPFADEEGSQLVAKNVILQFLPERSLGDDKRHLMYKTTGEGEAKILIDGKIIEGKWSRSDIEDRTKYFDAKTGEEIKFNRGLFWIEIVPKGNTISYTAG